MKGNFIYHLMYDELLDIAIDATNLVAKNNGFIRQLITSVNNDNLT